MCCQNYLQAFIPLKTIKQAVIRNIIDHIISVEKIYFMYMHTINIKMILLF